MLSVPRLSCGTTTGMRGSSTLVGALFFSVLRLTVKVDDIKKNINILEYVNKRIR